MSRRKPAPRAPLRIGALIVGALLGGALGGWASPRYGADFEPPQSVDASEWSVVIPGWSEGVVSPELGRGTHLQGGALVIGRYAFDRADRLLPVNQGAVGAVELTLAPDSGAAELIFRGPYGSDQRAVFVRLRPESVLVPGPQEAWTTRAPGPYRFEIRGGEVVMAESGVSLGSIGPGTIELTGVDGVAKIQSIRISGRDGAALLDADYSAQGQVAVAAGPWVVGGAAVGASLAAAAASGVGGLIAALLCLALPWGILRVSAEGWLKLVEKLYLTRTPAWELAEGVFLASWIPLLALGVLRAGALRADARARRQKPWLIWGVSAATLAAATWGRWDGPAWAVVVGAVFMAWPARLVDACRGRVATWFLRDLPAFAMVLIGGWGVGLLGAGVWRILLVASNTRGLLERAPGPASDLLLFAGLVTLPAAEAALRSTYLGDAWTAASLAGASGISREQNWRDLQPFWSGSCGDEAATGQISLVFTGGSSTGGAYQFGEEPEAFFPARVHAALCEDLPPGVLLTTWNYGEGGRNTFTISRTLDALVEATSPDLVVMYVGVNDLLTRNDTLTRKQREEIQAGDGALLQALTGRSRLITGLALGARPGAGEDAEEVSEVPLGDAAENLDWIAGGLAGVPLLMSSQHVSAQVAPTLEPYWSLEQDVAARFDNATFVDVRAQMTAAGGSELLVDRNHLSRSGNQALADALLPSIRQALGWPSGVERPAGAPNDEAAPPSAP